MLKKSFFAGGEFRLTVRAVNECLRIRNDRSQNSYVVFNPFDRGIWGNDFAMAKARLSMIKREGLPCLNKKLVEVLELNGLKALEAATTFCARSFLVSRREQCKYWDLAIKYQQLVKSLQPSKVA